MLACYFSQLLRYQNAHLALLDSAFGASYLKKNYSAIIPSRVIRGALMSTDYRKYANVPLKQLPNRVWRTYEGGAFIDRFMGASPEVDGHLPEEWIMSTIAARGKNRPENEGLSLIETESGVIPLKDLIASDPALFLGEELAEKYGTTGVLIKLLDSSERLTIQVHPDKAFAREQLNSEFGKTESWYILGGREIAGEKSAVYMGFKEGVTKDKWEILFREQDIVGMLDCLHKIEVQSGDAFMVYGGVPHAIGAGCFLLEVQEPTDYTMRVERTTPAGLEIDDALIHQGVGIEKMLECFHYKPCSLEQALDQWKIEPVTIDETDSGTLRSLFNETHTHCFGVSELELGGEYAIKGGGRCSVAVVRKGEGTMVCDGKTFDFAPGDEIFFSAAIGEIIFRTNIEAKILLCYPPVVESI